jgi:hypothetical protein
MKVINEEIYRPLQALDKIYLELQWMKLAIRYTQIEDCRQQAYHISLYTKLNAPPALKNR